MHLLSSRNLVTVAQLALSLMMLAAGGLFVHSAFHASSVEPGFTLEREVLVETDPGLAGYDNARARQIDPALLARLRSLPSIESVALAARVPFGDNHLFTDFRPGGGGTTTAHVSASLNSVTEDYFKTLGIPLLEGRAFRASEMGGQKPSVVILDTLAANRLWPGSGAIGKHLSNDMEVVGVVGAVREGIIGGNPNPLPPHVYTPFGRPYNVDTQIHLRVTPQGREAEPRLLETIRQEIQRVDDRLPVLTLKTLANHVDSSFDAWVTKTGARIVGIFAMLAVVLGVVGLYGVRVYIVARRTREIGFRMAVGADSAEVLTMVLREGLAVAAIGIAVGMALALALGRVMATILYGVPTVDAAVLSVAALLLAGVSAMASYLPARRAANVDPMVALRDE